MLRVPYEDIVARIREKSGLDEAEIGRRVDERISMLSGLVSREGAAHIIANELGVRLFEPVSGRMEIRNILAGLRDVEVLGRVVAVYDARSFQSSGREGRVASVQIADETGQVRVVLWNEMADFASKLKAGDVLRVKGGYVRQRGSFNEVHLNDRSKLLINPEGESVNVPVTAVQPASRKNLAELQGGEGQVEVLATIVQVFEPRFFEVCHCGKRARLNDGSAVCEVHGAVSPSYSYVLNAYLDDGTESVRAVFFREQTQKLLGLPHEGILAFRDSPDAFENVRNGLLGASVKILGKSAKNDMFNRVELVASSVLVNPEPDDEIARLQQEVEKLREQRG